VLAPVAVRSSMLAAMEAVRNRLRTIIIPVVNLSSGLTLRNREWFRNSVDFFPAGSGGDVAQVDFARRLGHL